MIVSPRTRLPGLLRLTVVLVLAVLVAETLIAWGSPVPVSSASPAPVVRVDPQMLTKSGPAWLVTKNAMASGPERTALIDLLDRQIRRQGAGDTIRLTTWSFHNQRIADALVRAKNRGATVRVVVDRRTWRTQATRTLRRALGTSSSSDSFIVAPYTQSTHTKMATFSHDGTVLISSANVSDPRQWNHTVVLQNPDLYRQVSAWADRLGAGDGMTYTRVRVPGTILHFYPGRVDPVLRAIRRAEGRRITVQMSIWNGRRGRQIADALIEAHRSGSPVAVNIGSAYNDVVRSVAAAGIDVFDTRRATNGRAKAHDKLLVVGDVVYTGSTNWGAFPRTFSEVVARINSPELAERLRAYVSRTRVQAGGKPVTDARAQPPRLLGVEPRTPRSAVATFGPGDGQATLALAGYEVAWSSDGGQIWRSRLTSSTSLILRRLTPDVRTRVKVRIVPSVGTPSPYTATQTVRPTRRPHPPANVRTRLRRSGVAVVRWQEPGYVGRSAVQAWVLKHRTDERGWRRTKVRDNDRHRVILRRLPTSGDLEVRVAAVNRQGRSRFSPIVSTPLRP
jgi:hypothetical protein